MQPNSGLLQVPIPDKALRLAKMNVQVRNTPRARALVAQALTANA